MPNTDPSATYDVVLKTEKTGHLGRVNSGERRHPNPANYTTAHSSPSASPWSTPHALVPKSQRSPSGGRRRWNHLNRQRIPQVSISQACHGEMSDPLIWGDNLLLALHYYLSLLLNIITKIEPVISEISFAFQSLLFCLLLLPAAVSLQTVSSARQVAHGHNP